MCATCIARQHAVLKAAPRARVSAALVADTIQKARGDVWPAVNRHAISYEHARRIRAGWRGAGRKAPPIPYRSQGWFDGKRPGWSARLEVYDGPEA